MLVLLHLFALFLLVLLGFYVFVADPRKRANQTFAAFILFLALWTSKDLIFWDFSDIPQNAGWWTASSFVIALLMQFALVVFAWVFPENARTPRTHAAILFAPATILIPAAVFGLLWKRVGFDDGAFFIELSPLAYAYVAYVYFVFFFGAAVLITKYRHFRRTQKGQQAGAIIWALAITVVFKTAANIVLPFFGVYSLLPISSLFVLPGVVIYAYAISNFRLFSLTGALDQFRLFPITYKIALSIATVAIASFVLFQVPIVWWSFRNGTGTEAWRKYLVFSVMSALVPNLLLVLLIVRSISRPLQRITVAAVQVAEGDYGAQVDLRNSNDELGLLAASFNDMSRKMAVHIEDLRRLNEQLLHADRLAAMGTLAAGVAHEVNNPLASISSLIQMMRKRENIDVETKDELETILQQIRRISRVTGGLTEFAHARAAARCPVNINEVVEAGLRLASFDERFQTLDIKRSLSPDLEFVSADEDQLQQVILNILLNARDAMPDGGTLTVSTSMRDGSVEISIADTGSGIPEAMAGKVFDPFVTTKAAGDGTGLGLSVCYGIITAHGGTISVDRPGKIGTTFRIRLPAVSRPTALDSRDE